ELIDDLDCAAVKVKTNNTIVASIRQIDHAGADGEIPRLFERAYPERFAVYRRCRKVSLRSVDRFVSRVVNIALVRNCSRAACHHQKPQEDNNGFGSLVDRSHRRSSFLISWKTAL